MEQRHYKILISSSGGTAGKGAKTYRLSIPTSWIKDMGLSGDSRDVLLTYDDGKIIVEKINEGDVMSEGKINEIVSNTVASLRLEGMICTEEEIESTKRMLRGEISREEAMQAIIDKYVQEEREERKRNAVL